MQWVRAWLRAWRQQCQRSHPQHASAAGARQAAPPWRGTEPGCRGVCGSAGSGAAAPSAADHTPPAPGQRRLNPTLEPLLSLDSLPALHSLLTRSMTPAQRRQVRQPAGSADPCRAPPPPRRVTQVHHDGCSWQAHWPAACRASRRGTWYGDEEDPMTRGDDRV